MNRNLIIGSRGSKLALWQAEYIKTRLEATFPQIPVKIEIIKTTGDILQSVSLAKISGKGAFTKEIEEALLRREVDLAVHSLKDLPTRMPENLEIRAITERESPFDAVVLPLDAEYKINSIKDLPEKAVVGTSSPRRQSQIKSARPDITFVEIRGNVDTRLRKLDAGECDALVLAHAGLRRLSLDARVSAVLSADEMLPAVGQGALGIEIRTNDEEISAIVKTLNNVPTEAACTAERAFLHSLGGGCQVPIAGFAEVSGEEIVLRGLVAAPDGATVFRGKMRGKIAAAELLGISLAENLLAEGARDILFS